MTFEMRRKAKWSNAICSYHGLVPSIDRGLSIRRWEPTNFPSSILYHLARVAVPLILSTSSIGCFSNLFIQSLDSSSSNINNNNKQGEKQFISARLILLVRFVFHSCQTDVLIGDLFFLLLLLSHFHSSRREIRERKTKKKTWCYPSSLLFMNRTDYQSYFQFQWTFFIQHIRRTVHTQIPHSKASWRAYLAMWIDVFFPVLVSTKTHAVITRSTWS